MWFDRPGPKFECFSCDFCTLFSHYILFRMDLIPKEFGGTGPLFDNQHNIAELREKIHCSANFFCSKTTLYGIFVCLY